MWGKNPYMDVPDGLHFVKANDTITGALTIHTESGAEQGHNSVIEKTGKV